MEDTEPLLLCFWASFDSGKASSTKSHREQILDPLSNTLINRYFASLPECTSTLHDTGGGSGVGSLVTTPPSLSLSSFSMSISGVFSTLTSMWLVPASSDLCLSADDLLSPEDSNTDGNCFDPIDRSKEDSVFTLLRSKLKLSVVLRLSVSFKSLVLNPVLV